MTRIFWALAVFGIVAILSAPVQANGVKQSGIHAFAQHEFSSRHRGSRHVTRMHYYDPYPWWWHPPFVKRARTNYLGWPHSNYPPFYDKPYFGGVTGYPGSFYLYGL